jgi:hypothetical protein
MPSELKSATARINGAKSRGPKTAATREKSSLNALNHGFTAHSTVLLQCEDPSLFQKIRDEYAATFQPATPAEEVLVDEMIVARWRIQRLWTIETALFDREVIRHKPELENEARPNAAVNLALAFRALADESYSLGLLSRYESRLQRTHERTYRTLRQLQQERLTPNQPDPPAAPPPRQEPPDPTKPSQGLSSGSTPVLVNRDRKAAAPKLVPSPGIGERNCETNPANLRNPGEGWAKHADHSRSTRIETQEHPSSAAQEGTGGPSWHAWRHNLKSAA